MKITMPIYWKVWKKTIPLGLNWYRNCYWRTLNTVKQEYTAEVIKQTKWERIKGTYGVSIELYLKTTAQDIDNFSCIWTKFIIDALVKAGVLEGDSNKNLIELHTVFCWLDKVNPRIEVTII